MMVGRYTVTHELLKDPNFNVPYEVWRTIVYGDDSIYMTQLALSHNNCPIELLREILEYYVNISLRGDTYYQHMVFSALASPKLGQEDVDKAFLKMIQLPNFIQDNQLYFRLADDSKFLNLSSSALDQAADLLSDPREITMTNYRNHNRKIQILEGLMGNPNMNPDTAIKIRRAKGDVAQETPDAALEPVEEPKTRIKSLEDLQGQSFNWYRLAKSKGKMTVY